MNEEHAKKPAASDADAQTSSPLRVALFAILAVMLLALAYDYLWARRQLSDADKAIQALLAPADTGATVTSAEPSTISDVQKAIGRAPSEETEGQTYLLEKYSWRAGLPWKTHDLYVVYTKSKPPMLHCVSAGVPPGSDQLPMKKLSDMSEDELKAMIPKTSKPSGDEQAEGDAEAAADGEAPTASEDAEGDAPGDEPQTQDAGIESEPAPSDPATPADEEEKEDEEEAPQTDEPQEESAPQSAPSN
jgi:hypothetical protein